MDLLYQINFFRSELCFRRCRPIRGQVDASSVKFLVPLFKGSASTGFGRARILSAVTVLVDALGVFAILPGLLGLWYTLA